MVFFVYEHCWQRRRVGRKGSMNEGREKESWNSALWVKLNITKRINSTLVHTIHHLWTWWSKTIRQLFCCISSFSMHISMHIPRGCGLAHLLTVEASVPMRTSVSICGVSGQTCKTQHLCWQSSFRASGADQQAAILHLYHPPLNTWSCTSAF